MLCFVNRAPVNCTVATDIGSWGYLNGLSYLAGLQNNGGPTLTHALKPGSNAIDAGDSVNGDRKDEERRRQRKRRIGRGEH